jgi:flagellar P-ring protein precursor FlgI
MMLSASEYLELRRQRESRLARQRVNAAAVGLIVSLLALFVLSTPSHAQDTRIRDLTVEDRAVPVRLMGYGIVVGLDNTGDRVSGGRNGGGMTVSSVVNLLRRFDVEVPAEVVRMRNVAAVLVTAEVSPYLRAGGKFEVSVSSVGDARSLRGGVLWMTPLLADVGGKPVASAQGAMLISQGEAAGSYRAAFTAENSARIPQGGLLEVDMPRPQFASTSRLVLREPDVGTAARIAVAINKVMGDSAARVEDPGSVALAFKADEKRDRATLLSQIRDILVRPDRPSRLVIDSRDGTVVAGGEMIVGDAVVSHGGITLTIGARTAADSAVAATPPDSSANAPRPVLSVASSTSVSRIAAALHAMQAPPSEISAIFEALRAVGALAAEIVVR